MDTLTRTLTHFELLGLPEALAAMAGYDWKVEGNLVHQVFNKGNPFPSHGTWLASRGALAPARITVNPRPPGKDGVPLYWEWHLSSEKENGHLSLDRELVRLLHTAPPARFESKDHLAWFLEESTTATLLEMPENLGFAAQQAVPKVLVGWEHLGSVIGEKGSRSFRIEVRQGEWVRIEINQWHIWRKGPVLHGFAILDREESMLIGGADKSCRFSLVMLGRPLETEATMDLFNRDLDTHLYDGTQIRGGKYHGSGSLIRLKEPITMDQLVFEPKTQETLERELLGFFELESRYRQAGLPFKRGILLEGPPGTGKTSLAKVIAHRFPQTVIWIQGGEIVEPQDVSRVFRLARLGRPSVLFFEDADLYLRSRDNVKGEDKILAAFIAEMDGLDENDGLLVVLTTNRVNDLEAAVANRPGRVDMTVHLGELGRDMVLQLLAKRFKGWTFEAGWEAEIPAMMTLTGASTVELATRIMLHAMRHWDGQTGLRRIGCESVKKAVKEQDRAQKRLGFQR